MENKELVKKLDERVRNGELKKIKERHVLNRWGKISSGEPRSNVVVYIYRDLKEKDVYRVTHRINEKANYHHIHIEEYAKDFIQTPRPKTAIV